MANQEHLDLLRRGVEYWNPWRQEHQRTWPDLSKADLEGADLEGADLTGANLSHTDLRRANLSYANLSDSDLSHALQVQEVL